MKGTLLAAAVVIALSIATGPAAATAQSNFKPGSEPEGFGEMKWGTRLETLTGMTRFGTEPRLGGIEKYTRSSDVARTEGAQVSGILYGFWREQLMSVAVEASGTSACAALLRASIDRYGPGYKTKKSERYRWNGPLTEILYDGTGNHCVLLMQSNKVREEAERHLRAAPEQAGDTAR